MKKIKETDCKLIEKKIPLYLENKLSSSEIRALLDHVETCKNCREELTIQYMVSEGLSKAENENDYDLLKNLKERISESDKQVKNHDFLVVGFMFIGVAILLIILASVMKVVF